VITYAGLISVMPRAGGDYVWQSRVMSGGLAFVLAVTGWWFILWYWTPIYAAILNVEVLQPLAALFQQESALEFLASNNGLFVVCVITALLAGFLVSLGMEGYAKVQKVCFYIGMAGLAIIFLVMLFGSRSGFESAFNSESARLFGVDNAYQAHIDFAATDFPGLSLSPFFGNSLLLIPFLMFWIAWPNWGATLYGEVRGASDFKRVMSGMMYGLWVSIAIGVVFLLLSSKFFGWQFFQAANYNYANYYYAYTTDPVTPVWSYPPLLIGMWFGNSALGALLILVFGAWFIGWAGTLFLSSTRVIFAAAFDRVLPEKVADVSEKRHVPYWAMALMLIPALIVSAFYAYSVTFRGYLFAATFVIVVTFFGTSIAAAILPWRKKQLYENSPIAHYKVLGIPLITISGTITALFLGWNIYKWAWPPFAEGNLYGINVPDSMYFMGGMYLLALVIYAIARIYRKSQGIDLKAVYKEIPVE
jgi:amino acid transporter